MEVGERIALMLPDGDLAAVDDETFVAWLQAHGEPAPFGLGNQTRVDPKVRSATRLCARGEVQVHGFEAERLLPQIEAALSPHTRLTAELTDVLAYLPGGHFARHKDTPVTSDLLGTLIVGLPIEHGGGAFEIEDERVDWSGPIAPRTVRWMAMFTDVDHAVQPVTRGARCSLVYALYATGERRDDTARDQRIAALRAAAQRVQIPGTLALRDSPLMIACARHVIAPDAPQPQRTSTLRGRDRDVAEAFERAGYRVAVRTCVALREDYGYDDDEPHEQDRVLRDGDESWYARLREPLTPDQISALLSCVVFDDQISGDGGGYFEDHVTSLAPWLAGRIDRDRWIFRRPAAATFQRSIDFSDDGFVGNGAVSSFLYKLAALEITR